MIAAHQGTESSRDPTICGGIVSPACVQSSVAVISAKDDHFAAGPDRSVAVSGGGHVDHACRSPGVCRGSVPSAAIQIAAVYPPLTIISMPVQTAVWWYRAKGALVRL